MALIHTRRNRSMTQPAEHAVIIEFDYGLSDLGPMMSVIKRLERVLEETGDGEFDGWEVAMDLSDGTFHMYGPDAEELFYSVRPTLLSVEGMRGARVTLRSEPGAKEKVCALADAASHHWNTTTQFED